MQKKKARMGRPPKPPSEKLSALLCLHMTQGDRKRLEVDAKRAGLSLGGFMVRCWRRERERG